jgi:hypothetical protein
MVSFSAEYPLKGLSNHGLHLEFVATNHTTKGAEASASRSGFSEFRGKSD